MARRVSTILKLVGYVGYAVFALVIIAVLTPIAGVRGLNVLTGSMSPALHPGDLVIVTRASWKAINPGDIITYADPKRPGATITHRLVRTDTSRSVPMLVTKGDANSSSDAPFPAGRLVGKVVATIPGAGYLTGVFHNPLALAALVIVPGVIVIAAEARRLRELLARPAGPSAQDAPPA